MTGWCATSGLSHQLVGVLRFLGLTKIPPYCEQMWPNPAEAYEDEFVSFSYPKDARVFLEIKSPGGPESHLWLAGHFVREQFLSLLPARA